MLARTASIPKTSLGWGIGLAAGAALGLALLLVSYGAEAAEDRCIAVSRAPDPAPGRQTGRPRVQRAQFRPPPVGQPSASDGIRITYVGHSTFLVVSREGVRIATDFNDYVRPPELPDIVTMNRAHSSHFTDSPDPGIAHVLRGWSPDGGPALHDLTVRDVRIRNLPTNIRGYGSSNTDEFGNSIFIFEMGALCIAHLGHLHHTLSARQLGQIGQMDVVFAPVDGSYTLDTPGMIEVLKGLKAPLVVPMHYFTNFTLNRFLDVARADFAVEMSPVGTITVARATLPARPTLMILPGG